MANPNAAPVVMHGARAIMSVAGQVVGIFTNVSYGVQYDVSPLYVLGRFSAIQTEYTGMEPVQVTCSGWRVLNKGPYAAMGQSGQRMVPKLQELLTAQDITLSIYDRQDNTTPIMEVTNCKAQGWNTTIQSRTLQEITVNFIGLIFSDEEDSTSGGQAEPAGSSTLT